MITFTIAPDNADKYEVRATTRDILFWERTTKGASLKRLLDELHLSDLYSVAHRAAHRLGLYSGTLKDFEGENDLEFEVEDESDPTPSDR